MAKHNVLGAAGEALAVQWLQDKGYIVLYQNWRYARFEVDIVANFKDVLHFVEVKTRRSTRFGNPEESVGQKKIFNLMQAGSEFQYRYPQWKKVQYDVLSICIAPDGTIDYFFIEDIYL